MGAELIDYLVTSRIRRRLLRLIWSEEIAGTLHQISKLSGYAYSAVYREISEMKRQGIIKTKPRGKMEYVMKNSSFRNKNLLDKLLGGSVKKVKMKQINDSTIYSNLVKYGAPLFSLESSGVELTPEEAAIYGLRLAEHNATVSRALPVFFAKNADLLDFNRLSFLANKLNLKSVLGLFLDITGQLSGKQKFTKISDELFDKRRKKDAFFFKKGELTPLQRQLTILNTPKVAHKWHYLMNMGMDSFESLFYKNIPRRK